MICQNIQDNGIDKQMPIPCIRFNYSNKSDLSIPLIVFFLAIR